MPPGENDDNKNKGTTKVAPVDAPNNPVPEKKDTPDDKVQKPEEKLLFGKYKSTEEAEKGFKELEKNDIVDLRIIPAVGCEKFAEFIYNYVEKIIKDESQGRVWLDSVEVREHGANSAIYTRD